MILVFLSVFVSAFVVGWLFRPKPWRKRVRGEYKETVLASGSVNMMRGSPVIRDLMIERAKRRRELFPDLCDAEITMPLDAANAIRAMHGVPPLVFDAPTPIDIRARSRVGLDLSDKLRAMRGREPYYFCELCGSDPCECYTPAKT